MKPRYLLSFFLLILLCLFLSRDAIIPDRFTGIWYAEKSAYQFEDGIIEQILPEETPKIDGAYMFTRDTITLFVSEVEELQNVTTLHWQYNPTGDFLYKRTTEKDTILFSRAPR